MVAISPFQFLKDYLNEEEKKNYDILAPMESLNGMSLCSFLMKKEKDIVDILDNKFKTTKDTIFKTFYAD